MWHDNCEVMHLSMNDLDSPEVAGSARRCTETHSGGSRQWATWRGQAQPGQPGAGRALPADIERLVACIEANPFDPELNAEVVKRRCGLRDHNTSSRFRFYIGASIRNYLEARRLEEAARLLRESRATVLEVALSVGYNNVQTFYGAFRRRYACTPAAYRSSAG